MRASGRPGQMPSASWPARSPIASRRARPATSRPGRPCPYCVTNTTRRYRSSRQGVVDDVVQRLRGTVRAHRPDRGHRPDAHLRPAASADDPGPVCGPLQRTTPSSQPNSARPGPTTLSPASPRNGSNAGPSSAASSTDTIGPHKSQGQHQWSSSGTPQVPGVTTGASAAALARAGSARRGRPGRPSPAPVSGSAFAALPPPAVAPAARRPWTPLSVPATPSSRPGG